MNIDRNETVLAKIPARILLAVLFCLLLSSRNALADTLIPGDLLFFPNVQFSHRADKDVGNTENNRIEAGLGVFYSYQDERLLALIEYILNRDENEFERLQFGLAIDDQTQVWLGRYHNILGYWNTAYHHGTYIQTSISRPGIVAFEDYGGVIPMYTSGLLLIKDVLLQQQKLNVSLSIGFGPTMENRSLQPMKIFSPGGETYHENLTARISYYPDIFGETQFSLFAGHTRMEGDKVSASEIVQKQLGASLVIEAPGYMILGSAFHIENRLKPVGSGIDKHNHFFNAYLQTEFSLSENWTGYARLEDTRHHDNDPYLALIPEFIEQREALGLRYDFSRKQALTLEIRHDHQSRMKNHYLAVQWSALLP